VSMKENAGRRRYSPKEQLRILEEARQTEAKISEVCRRYGISCGQFYRWEELARDGALERLTQGRKKKKDKGSSKEEALQHENERLKSVIAEITTENLELKKNFIL